MRRAAVLGARLRAQHLDQRLPPGSITAAAWGGLQDSAPRSAVLSLHARVAGVQPGDWEHPELVQVWGPRGAVWVVPVADVAVFTLGSLPRRAARRPVDVPEEWVDTSAVAVSQRALREASATGTLRIRWDGSRTYVRRAPAPEADPEEARRELCRRFRAVYPGASADGFAWWAGVPATDAQETWEAAGAPGPVPDVRETAGGVRLLPPGDPWLNAPDREVVVRDEARRAELWPAGGVWPGAVVAGAEVVGSWRRRQGRLTVTPWRRLGRALRAALEDEAASLPVGGPVALHLVGP